MADNLDATEGSPNPEWNPGGYDAVNRYGDEIGYQTAGSVKDYPGLGSYHRLGIEEVNLVDYDTRNLKFNTALHYKIRPDLELSYAFNFGFGTTVYQGDNRFSLRDIQFFQNKIEIAKKDKWFIRAYSTNENARDENLLVCNCYLNSPILVFRSACPATTFHFWLQELHN